MLAHVALETRIADAWRFTLDPPVGQRIALFLPLADIWTHQRVIENFAHTWSKDNQIHLIANELVRVLTARYFSGFCRLLCPY